MKRLLLAPLLLTILTGCMNSKDKIIRLRCDVRMHNDEKIERIFWDTYDITLSYKSSSNVYGEIEIRTALNTKYVEQNFTNTILGKDEITFSFDPYNQGDIAEFTINRRTGKLVHTWIIDPDTLGERSIHYIGECYVTDDSEYLF